MQYYTTYYGEILKVHVCDSTTGKVVTIWPGAIPGSYNVVNEMVSILPGPNGSGSAYQAKIAFFTESTRADVLSVLQDVQAYFNSL